MKMKKWGIIAACTMLVAALGAFGCSSSEPASDSTEPVAQDYTLITPGTLTVGTSPDYPPFENMVDGEYVGFDIDLVKAIAEQMGLQVEFKTIQFDGIMTAVAAGGQVDVGISGISVDPERAEVVDFTNAYYVDNLAVATMSDNTTITTDNAETALNNADVTIAVQSGTTGESYVQENYPNATIQPYGNSTDCFAAMQSGQANAVCTNSAVVERMIQEAYSDAHIVLSIATGEEYALVGNKDNPGLIEAINNALSVLQENGTIEELMTQYL